MVLFQFKLKRLTGLMVAGMALLCASASYAVSETQQRVLGPEDFAIVGDEIISMREFQAAYHAGIRKRFYHGKVPEERLQAFRKEISQTLIDRSLLLQEARRRGLAPDEAQVKAQLARYEARYQKQPHWQENRETILAGLRAALEEESLLMVLERQVKAMPEPLPQEVREYYQAHPELFTTPEQLRLSLILLKVAPSSTAEVWQAAHEEALRLRQRLQKGADFAQMARIHSGDASAAAGGDMGFVHKGMLAAPVQQVVDGLQPGQVSEPVVLLSGVALFRLEERIAARLNDFEAVAERARQLLQRERSQAAWEGLLARLRSTVQVSVNTAAVD